VSEKLGTLHWGKAVVRISRSNTSGWNESEYRKGRHSAYTDCRYSRMFGQSCRKLTVSYCTGYVLAWNMYSTRARFTNTLKRFDLL
jgi:hypothetical protein